METLFILLRGNLFSLMITYLGIGTFIFLFLYVCVYIIDSVSLSTIEGVGTITNKNSENMVSNEKYENVNTLTILVDDVNLYDEVVVDKTLYDSLEENQKINISYSKGRLRNTIYIKNINIK